MEESFESVLLTNSRIKPVDAPDQIQEIAWVAASRGGDTLAFNRLVLKWERPIYNLALRMLQDPEEAAESTQEVFLSAFKNIGRFRQEYQFLSKLQHPNLPLIYDTFNEGDRFYFVMDFIEGKTLLDLLRASGGRPLPIGQVVDYAMQLCDVLSYLHMQTPPVIFRDLKPTNVMIREDGRLFLIDFGIARFFKEGKLQDTVLLGSPGYAPPGAVASTRTSCLRKMSCRSGGCVKPARSFLARPMCRSSRSTVLPTMRYSVRPATPGIRH